MRVQELTKQYDGKTVVDGVSFAIPKGKVISLIGPNGAGKSTVMGMISRLIAHDSGLVDFEGKDIGKWKSKELSKRLAILTQSNNIQMKLTVRELVTFGRFPYSGTGFFRGGFLAGMTYKMFAEELDIHESTVCRIVSNKYVSCPQGILPLKYFFSKGVDVVDGQGRVTGTMGKSSVKELIAFLIEKEPGDRPYRMVSSKC